MIFSWRTDSFLRWIEAGVDDVLAGTTRACADDVGSVVKHLSALRVYEAAFGSALRRAALALKLKKCILVLPAGPFKTQLVAVYKNWLNVKLA